MVNWLTETWIGRLFQPPVRVWPAVIAILAFCMAVRLAVLLVLTAIPGVDVPAWAWFTGLIGMLLVAAPLSMILLGQLSRNHRLSLALQEANAAMQEAYAIMKTMAETDDLTGLANRRAFLAAVESKRQAMEWFIIGDVDHFKTVNDRFGHAQGDASLKAIAGAIRATVPAGGLVGRLGGEEFAIYLPGADRETAIATAEDIRDAVAALKIITPNEGLLSLTISLGVAGGEPIALAEHGFSLADCAMYEAKAAGRNRVCEAHRDPVAQPATLRPPAFTMNSATAGAPSPLAMAANT